MKAFSFKKVCAACSLFITPVSSFASQSFQASPDNTFYVGYRAGLSLVDLDYESTSYSGAKSENFSQGLLIGYQFDSPWAVEAFWQKMGDAEVLGLPSRETRGTVDVKSYGAGVSYRFEYQPNLNFSVQAGAAETSRDYHFFVDLKGEDDIDPYVGAGVRWAPFETWQVRADYTFFSEDLRLISLGLVKHFYLGSRPDDAQAYTPPPSIRELTPSSVKQCEDFIIEFEGVEFASSSVALDEDARTKLDDLAKQIKALPQDIHIEVRAHADQEGTESYNYSLSLVRARAVRDYLAKQGVALSRISAEGYGEWGLSGIGSNDQARVDRRRAELVLVGVEKYLDQPSQCGQLVRENSSM